jgi:hypothetical protein
MGKGTRKTQNPLERGTSYTAAIRKRGNVAREKYIDLGETDHQDGRWTELAGLGSCPVVGFG